MDALQLAFWLLVGLLWFPAKGLVALWCWHRDRTAARQMRRYRERRMRESAAA